MAQFNLMESDGRNAALLGEYQAPLASLVMDRDKLVQNRSIARKIFSERKSTHRLEGYASMTAVDSFAPVPESGPYPTGGFEQGYDKTLTNVTWKGSFGVSKEMREDSVVVDLTRVPNAFMNDYERKLEGFFARLLGEAVLRNAVFAINGMSFDTKGADGLSVFSKAHPYRCKTGTQTNWYADAFSADALGGICTAMQNAKDDNGNIMSLVPDTIIIPNLAALKKAVWAVVGSEKVPGSGNNDFNYLFQNFRIIVWDKLNQFIAADTMPYIVMSSGYNEDADCCVFQNRKELTLEDEIASNGDYLWKGDSRFAGGFVDWRGVFLGGIAGGTSL